MTAGAEEALRLVEDARSVRGVMAAAVLSVDGEVVAAAGEDASLLEHMQQTATSALAAAEAFAALLDVGGGEAAAGESESAAAAPGADEDGAEGDGAADAAETKPSEAQGGGETHLTVIYQGGHPLLFEPLSGGERVVVVAVETHVDIGRARFQLRRLAASLGA
ncbi:MAG TPA: hypothetical protein VKY42_09830 [Trueperaceae bacterium]|nr:hypothetical protein [Trueperaceae bacterium]